MTNNNWLKRFARSRKDRWIGGVCGGLGANTPVPSWTWRLIFALAFFIWGTGLILYILLWIFAPEEKNGEDIPPSA
ncbi:MAG: PspC domain-containing protein [Smithella sp.]